MIPPKPAPAEPAAEQGSSEQFLAHLMIGAAAGLVTGIVYQLASQIF